MLYQEISNEEGVFITAFPLGRGIKNDRYCMYRPCDYTYTRNKKRAG